MKNLTVNIKYSSIPTHIKHALLLFRWDFWIYESSELQIISYSKSEACKMASISGAEKFNPNSFFNEVDMSCKLAKGKN